MSQIRERRRIVELWGNGGAVAMVTLVRVEGSSYRRVGARLLLGQDGEYAGAISGGCLEAEVLRKAKWLSRGGAIVERYSTLFDDTAEMPYGLGCGGTVDLLIEPAETHEFNALMTAMQASLQGNARQVATVLPGNGAGLQRWISDATGKALFGDRSSLRNAHCFEERLDPPQRLFVFGAGDDARPLVTLASLLGWEVIVVDGRLQWAIPARFPEASQVLATSAPSDLLKFDIGADDAVILMTHSYEQDSVWLAAVSPSFPRYLGLLGARHRSSLLATEAARRLGWSLDQICCALFAPVGLDLGGDGAEAIALAVIAEVQACIEGKLGIPRRMTPQMISEQIARHGSSLWPQGQCSL